MRCRAGDLAVIVSGPRMLSDCIGKVVRVLVAKKCDDRCCDIWSLETPFDAAMMVNVDHWWDDGLRPLRDRPGTDETIVWAGRPRFRELIK